MKVVCGSICSQFIEELSGDNGKCKLIFIRRFLSENIGIRKRF